MSWRRPPPPIPAPTRAELAELRAAGAMPPPSVTDYLADILQTLEGIEHVLTDIRDGRATAPAPAAAAAADAGPVHWLYTDLAAVCGADDRGARYTSEPAEVTCPRCQAGTLVTVPNG